MAVLESVPCTDVECPLNVDGKCNSVSTILESFTLGGLPEPDGCGYGERLKNVEGKNALQ